MFFKFSTIAYHGSPYHFSKFNLTKIGINDGNKYGWGIYFTDNKDFGGSYSAGKMFYNGEEVKDVYISLAIIDLEKGINKQDIIEEYKDFKPYVAEFVEKFDFNKLEKKAGALYKCSIPDKNELLDWESDIKNQPIYNKLVKIAKKYQIDITSETYGSDFYVHLADKANGDKNASIILLTEENIPGLYYQDDGNCYVIWDVSKIKILEIK